MVSLGRKLSNFQLCNKKIFSLVLKELANQKLSLVTDSGGHWEWACSLTRWEVFWLTPLLQWAHCLKKKKDSHFMGTKCEDKGEKDPEFLWLWTGFQVNTTAIWTPSWRSMLFRYGFDNLSSLTARGTKKALLHKCKCRHFPEDIRVMQIELVPKNIGCQIKFEFQINNNYYF